ncbi:MAG: exodeoxyribonuclease VII small subunit [Candidatus Muiribacterium halophilum]|uniref:Exodeoxyribonuclease 7 small subunit n=1 Tax=Muiribacterium halophilum TaxID=2053465 RepID=A0A2N5ZI56_MUIH1|nr:MAG: exodeoxyribonuclease VII small subunit [Candidatus Muirbacterium halophilum]
MAKKNKKFEEALKELEEIVEEFENKEVDLDTSIKKFKKCTELLKYCESILNEAEGKIYALLEKERLQEIDEDE